MKKLVFSISLILSYTFIAIAGVVKSIPAKADDFTNGNIVTVTPSISETDLSTYNNALQVLEYLRQGGTIDFSNVSDNYTSGDLLDEFVDLIDTVGSGIDYYGNNFLNNIFDLSTDTVQLSPNTKLKDRIGQFRSNLPSYLRSQSSDDTPTPNPSPDFSFVSYINTFYLTNQDGTLYVDFFDTTAHTFNTGWGGYPVMSINGSLRDYTWVSSSFIGLRENSHNQAGLYKYCTAYSPLMTIYLNNNGDETYNAIYSASSPTNSVFTGEFGNPARGGYLFNYNGGTRVFTDYATSSSYTQQTFGSLSVAINYIYQHYCNITLYVDGELWALATSTPANYSISLGTGTYLKETNNPIVYQFEIPVYVDISDLLDKIQIAIDNKINLDFPYLNDLIVDTNGQLTLAVTVFEDDYTIDDLYVKDYGAMIPLFPLWVEYPVALEHINTVATVGIVDVIPADIIEVLGIFLIVGLFVFLCHRLME